MVLCPHYLAVKQERGYSRGRLRRKFFEKPYPRASHDLVKNPLHGWYNSFPTSFDQITFFPEDAAIDVKDPEQSLVITKSI